MYEPQKKIFENNFLRCELKASTGAWYLIEENNIYLPLDGKCCALSPSLIGEVCDLNSDMMVIVLAKKYNVSSGWVIGAVDGFDRFSCHQVDRYRDYQDGYKWGQYMRGKYYNIQAK